MLPLTDWQLAQVELVTAQPKKTSVSITSVGAPGAILNVTSYSMNDIHTTVDEVLA